LGPAREVGKTLKQGLAGGLIWDANLQKKKQKIQSHSNIKHPSFMGSVLLIFDILIWDQAGVRSPMQKNAYHGNQQ
jgi:hypothetical protein